MTIIFVTHNINEAIILSDRILVLRANPGRINRVLENSLSRPRLPDSPKFNQMWEQLHSLLDAESKETKATVKTRGELLTSKPLSSGAYFLEVEMSRKNHPRD